MIFEKFGSLGLHASTTHHTDDRLHPEAGKPLSGLPAQVRPNPEVYKILDSNEQPA